METGEGNSEGKIYQQHTLSRGQKACSGKIIPSWPILLHSCETQSQNNEGRRNTDGSARFSKKCNNNSKYPSFSTTTEKHSIDSNNSPAKAQSNKQKRQTNKQQKGSDDPIKLYNMFGELESMDAEETASCSQGSSKPSKGKFTPVLPPDK